MVVKVRKKLAYELPSVEVTVGKVRVNRAPFPNSSVGIIVMVAPKVVTVNAIFFLSQSLKSVMLLDDTLEALTASEKVATIVGFEGTVLADIAALRSIFPPANCATSEVRLKVTVSLFFLQPATPIRRAAVIINEPNKTTCFFMFFFIRLKFF